MSNNNNTERLIAHLAGTVIAFVDASNTQAAAAAAITQDVQRLITVMGQAHERQERMDRKIVVVRDDVAENKMTADGHMAMIRKNKTGIADNKAMIDDGKAGIAENKAKNDANKAGIAENKAKIAEIEMKTDANTEDISKLFRAFKKLKKDFEDRGAMTAARAVQPEAVGNNADIGGPDNTPDPTAD